MLTLYAPFSAEHSRKICFFIFGIIFLLRERKGAEDYGLYIKLLYIIGKRDCNEIINRNVFYFTAHAVLCPS